MARIRSVLRRLKPLKSSDSENEPTIFLFGSYQLDLLSQSLTRDNENISITSGEFSLLKIFLETPNKVLTRDTLLEKLKGYDCAPFDRSIDVRIMRLRQKIEVDTANPQFIQTVWGAGYRFVLTDPIQ